MQFTGKMLKFLKLDAHREELLTLDVDSSINSINNQEKSIITLSTYQFFSIFCCTVPDRIQKRSFH